MSDLQFADFFKTATGIPSGPFDYQCRLAGGEDANPEGNFTHGTACRSQLIEIPTGLGKTAGVVLTWLSLARIGGVCTRSSSVARESSSSPALRERDEP